MMDQKEITYGSEQHFKNELKVDPDKRFIELTKWIMNADFSVWEIVEQMENLVIAHSSVDHEGDGAA